MATWAEFADAEPEMAAVLRKQLDRVPICYLATTRRDGSPRVHPFCPIFADGSMIIAVAPTSPKRWDLARDGRYAMHGLPGDLDAEFYMTGRATRIDENAAMRAVVVEGAGHTVHPADWCFELSAEYVMSAYWENWGQPDTYAVRKEWRAG